MPDLFGIDIAGEIHLAMSPGLLDLTITRRIVGTRTAGQLTAGTNPTTTSHTGKGFIDSYKDKLIDGTAIQIGDRIIGIIGASITPAIVPIPDDRVTIEGTEYILLKVDRDPAAAMYTCQGRA